MSDLPTSRRGFLGLAAGATAASGLVLASSAPAAALLRQRRRVTILGGGVGGLTAAHELIERGFEVTVIEPKAWGGKARSIPVAGTGHGGRQDLPGEHGFRFFPGFYKSSPDTFSRIPTVGGSSSVMDHLVDAHQQLLCMPGQGQLWYLPSPNEDGLIQGFRSLLTLMGIAAGIPPNEIEYFVRKMLVFITSCDERRLGQWEKMSWTQFTNADNFSPMYQQVLGSGLTKTLVAAKGEYASARTVALMGEHFIYALLGENNGYIRHESGYGAADRLLDLPTNEAWIDPWLDYLRARGVRFVSGYRAKQLRVRNKSIESVVLETTGDGGFPNGQGTLNVTSDWFICAMPAEQMTKLLTPDVVGADPQLGRIGKLQTDWMNGIQYFLNRPPNIVIPGHVAFLDSPWAITAIDQGAFWRTEIASTYGDGGVADVYSVDISDWFTPGILYGKPAADCTPEEIARETWEQMKLGLNVDQEILTDDMLVRYFLDPAIHWPDGPHRRAANSEPLLINTANSWVDRPEAVTGIGNLFLASDYVRTGIDLATMEGANEAGRAAVNGILEASWSLQSPAVIHELWKPKELMLARQLDQAQYRLGLPNTLDIVPEGLGI
ncbi:hydroxysqualene dehydroxylase [Nocardioides limicola]|uniref:hydroxysqualene dehydroxylase n=1 Tax=Nocardioides limicola TaxID=2803368 RepID=UPI00193B5CEB|nr:NAD(P)-binding protein [Nocardioides sp. DJM-14]